MIFKAFLEYCVLCFPKIAFIIKLLRIIYYIIMQMLSLD